MTNPLPIDFDPLALRKAYRTIRWYAKKSRSTAIRFIAELDHALLQIATSPAQWPPHILGTRFYRLRRFPYLVIYRHYPSRVEIIAVSHGRRKKGYWRKRLP
jgi:plasmid stabilization system protein ParE